MHTNYDDIIKKIAEPPQWWDEFAVPRFCPFNPQRVADIYANEAALIEIACQNCGTHFMVAVSNDYAMESVRMHSKINRSALADSIQRRTLHWGDPPNTSCCAVGASMNCEDIRVVEFWRRGYDDMEWKRVPEYEVSLEGEAEPEPAPTLDDIDSQNILRNALKDIIIALKRRGKTSPFLVIGNHHLNGVEWDSGDGICIFVHDESRSMTPMGESQMVIVDKESYDNAVNENNPSAGIIQ